MTADFIQTQFEEILLRELELQKKNILVHGCINPWAIGFAFAQSNSKKFNVLPHLVVCPGLEEARTLKEAINFFDPARQIFVFPEYDVSPYSGLYPSPHTIHERLHFLHRALSPQPGDLFLLTAVSAKQMTLPQEILVDHSYFLKSGFEIPHPSANLFTLLGYQSAPVVEDVGQFSIRGGIIDFFSPAHSSPVRIELFGNQIDSLRFFDPSTQMSTQETTTAHLIPAQETLFLDENYEDLISRTREGFLKQGLSHAQVDDPIRSLVSKTYFPGCEFLLGYFYKNLSSPLEYFDSCHKWIVDFDSVQHLQDQYLSELKSDLNSASEFPIASSIEYYFSKNDLFTSSEKNMPTTFFSLLETLGDSKSFDAVIEYRSTPLLGFSKDVEQKNFSKIRLWKDENQTVLVSAKGRPQQEKIKLVLRQAGFDPEIVDENMLSWNSIFHDQRSNPNLIHIVPKKLGDSFRLSAESVVFIREADFLPAKERSKVRTDYEDFQKQARRLSFGDLKPGDLVVHVKHGIGQYEGLKVMVINGAESEFIQLSYKEKDKLYLPVYRVGQLQKFSGPSPNTTLDKLGGTSWEKVKTKVRSHLKDMAAELLSLYAKRAEARRPAFSANLQDINTFENSFPYEETEDQAKSIGAIYKDMESQKPMERLVCGDVGFGKTEVALRAAFVALANGRQVALLAPTTVLTFQHIETIKARFHGWPFECRVLNRFISPADAKKTLKDLKDGKVDLLVGTHRLLSKDVEFKNLGLLIIDEEQKFGVLHKERIKKLKQTVDTLTLSATPIPRTLNMSLMGIRDLSLINTAPIDRLPTRTFISKWEPEVIRKAISSEISRGGQVYFIHNRIQSIYGIADELRTILPEARIRVAHGQMPEHELEDVMVAFFHHEIDVLLCTAIVESGMDVPRANTMFIDRADMFGLSQLYQLRGRVGRSKQRAYCYLLLPRDKKLDQQAQERLKIIQENTALGSGIKIAQYDLELRGSGDILSEDQSGHVNAVGYEMYMDLLAEALANAKGEDYDSFELDPEINLKIPAMIPDSYINDVRIRLGYYKALADVSTEAELAKIEDELKDQFGPLPEPTVNLFGLMMIRRQCKELGVRDVSAGLKSISLIFTEKTRLKPETVIGLAMRENKKYSVTPDNRLNVRMNSITWSGVYEELDQLLKLQS